MLRSGEKVKKSEAFFKMSMLQVSVNTFAIVAFRIRLTTEASYFSIDEGISLKLLRNLVIFQKFVFAWGKISPFQLCVSKIESPRSRRGRQDAHAARPRYQSAAALAR